MLSASSATAAPTGSGSANDVVASLKSQGHNVMRNGSITEPLSECSVTGVHNPDAAGPAIGFTTVYVRRDLPGRMSGQPAGNAATSMMTEPSHGPP